MKVLSLIASAMAAGGALAKSVILDPENTASGKPVAIVWIHGMKCEPEAYQKPAVEFQKAAEAQGYKAWVGIPEFAFDVPEPILIDHYVESTIADLRKQGFTGDNVFLAAHSLGGVMTQIYTKLKPHAAKGQILMGSVLNQDKRSINKQGETEINTSIPTLTLAGEKDGLLRITRGAVSYYHEEQNITPSQKGHYRVYALDGVSHASFMDSSMLPDNVKKNDLSPEIDEQEGHQKIAKTMVGWISDVLGD